MKVNWYGSSPGGNRNREPAAQNTSTVKAKGDVAVESNGGTTKLNDTEVQAGGQATVDGAAPKN
jgi:hypothetical protein